jgi:hypothetical protein
MGRPGAENGSRKACGSRSGLPLLAFCTEAEMNFGIRWLGAGTRRIFAATTQNNVALMQQNSFFLNGFPQVNYSITYIRSCIRIRTDAA